MSAPALLILADDLSGAADCGIACTKAGLDTVVWLGDATSPPAAEALAIDADTRRWPADKAAAETARLVRAYVRPGQILFKKLDSTLRGNIGAEMAAALQTRRAMHGRCVALVAPAFPATGRTTTGGHQHLHGVRLEHSEMWRAEAMVGRAYIPAMLEGSGLRVAMVSLGCIRDAAAALLMAARDHDAIVCDAETDGDLARIAEAAMVLGRNTIWAGSAGLAHFLPQAAGLARAAPAATPLQVAGPILTIVGSAAAVSRRQAERLASQPGLHLVRVPPSLLWRDDSGGLDMLHEDLHAALVGGQDAAVMLAAEPEPDLARGALLAHGLAAWVAPLVRHAGALVMTGGETARAVLQRLGISGLRLIGEIEPGVPISVTDAGLTVVTKAGAFGRPDSLLACHRMLRAGASWETD